MHSQNRRKTILVLDDSATDAKLLQSQLEALDVNIITCSDSLEALKLLEKNYSKIDLMVQDHVREGINGLQLLQMLSKKELLSSLPIFVLTNGFADERDREQYVAQDIPIFYKPVVHADSLINTVIKTLKLS